MSSTQNIRLYGNQMVDNIVLSNTPFTSGEKAILKDKTKFSSLQWEDFPNAMIICNYINNDYSSSLPITGNIIGFDIKKKTYYDKTYIDVGSFTLDELAEGESEGTYNITDHNVQNNYDYTYDIFVLTDEKLGIVTTATATTYSNAWTLSPIAKVKGTKTQYKILTDENNNLIIWNFGVNCQESSMTQNLDRTVYQNLAAKPLVSIGLSNYLTGGLTCLLGEVTCNGEYYEPTILLKKFRDMIASNDLFLFKNPKGDTRIVTISDNPSYTYNNDWANLYKTSLDTENNISDITNRPTELSFQYTEIDDPEKYSIVSIGTEYGIL